MSRDYRVNGWNYLVAIPRQTTLGNLKVLDKALSDSRVRDTYSGERACMLDLFCDRAEARRLAERWKRRNPKPDVWDFC